MCEIPKDDLLVFLTEQQAADIFQCSVRTLQRHRLIGDGPPYSKLGRLVRYEQPALIAWMRSKRRTSTSEPDTNGEVGPATLLGDTSQDEARCNCTPERQRSKCQAESKTNKRRGKKTEIR